MSYLYMTMAYCDTSVHYDGVFVCYLFVTPAYITMSYLYITMVYCDTSVQYDELFVEGKQRWQTYPAYDSPVM